ncbi:methanogenesis marker protein 6 [Methanonatronarchaeum sp. AMET-Sl]|uniref:methanogenesis marker protein 6 n=1 Tax=Methanonatronarchaeum sp. AMET-Sl TaxID=3037654 RepID=UPI00244DD2F0|nr:methanogenesis marker protein 6 [Methanonatronarchaeum sp. AMET-Sl]WGI17713.1 methanogenesis marker protein 6 [Methanonatronarchaeum sp. AMET-Sl]
MTKTKMLVLSPESSLTPSYVSKVLHQLDLQLTIKETCYGVNLEGDEEEVEEAVEKALKLGSEDEIYVKTRGYPVADHRRCRATEGSRPGFCQLQNEFKTMSKIKSSPTPTPTGPEPEVEKDVERAKQKREEKLDPEKLQKLIDEIEEKEK